MKIEQVNTVPCRTGEGPLWDVGEQALYFIDIVARKVHRYDPATEQTRSWDVPNTIGSMALRAGGGAIVALSDGIYSLDFDTGKTAPILELQPWPEPGVRVGFNDAKVDRRGRFVVGTSHAGMTNLRPIASLYSFDTSGTLTTLDTGICISNGPCWAPDDKTFYHSDSYPHVTFAYDYDIETGKVENRRQFAETRELGGFPDGVTVDADGLIWMAICGGAKVAVYRPDGIIERIIEMPAKFVSSVMFGGANLDELYVTTLSAEMLGQSAEAVGSGTFVITGLGVRGIAEHRYAG